MKRYKILAFSGSLRKNSSNELMIKHLARLFHQSISIELYDRLSSLPQFNPDLDTQSPPAEVAELRSRIAEADGLLFCTPEYVFSLPGALKNMIDWNVSTTVFSGKPAAAIVAAASGKKAFESLKLILRTLELKLPDSSTLLINGGKGKIDESGEPKDDKLKTHIFSVLNSLYETLEAKKTEFS